MQADRRSTQARLDRGREHRRHRHGRHRRGRVTTSPDTLTKHRSTQARQREDERQRLQWHGRDRHGRLTTSSITLTLAPHVIFQQILPLLSPKDSSDTPHATDPPSTSNGTCGIGCCAPRSFTLLTHRVDESGLPTCTLVYAPMSTSIPTMQSAPQALPMVDLGHRLRAAGFVFFLNLNPLSKSEDTRVWFESHNGIRTAPFQIDATVFARRHFKSTQWWTASSGLRSSSWSAR